LENLAPAECRSLNVNGIFSPDIRWSMRWKPLGH